mmetsp:Transcript_11051/g.20440  ORF Transcript_11051/g.20440 Transcript_11051/m.20440 type:complete len:98 (-) Transcript_11051:782-1075(-)
MTMSRVPVSRCTILPDWDINCKTPCPPFSPMEHGLMRIDKSASISISNNIRPEQHMTNPKATHEPLEPTCHSGSRLLSHDHQQYKIGSIQDRKKRPN